MGKCLKPTLFFLLYFISASNLISQSSFGGYPTSIKWNQINTPIVRVIFPDSLIDRAQRVANIIHYLNNENVGLLGNKRKKVDIILRNHDVISNGYAQVAPLKSEFFMQAPQKTFEESNVDWTDLLAIHEYRHINQFVNARRGIGHLVYWLFGDYGWGALIGLTMPAWFLEGDATLAETALTGGGRGRVPSFSVEQRAQQSEGVQYSYMKAMNGSYKDFVPSHYNTGYLILSEMRKEATNADFDEITRRSSSFKGVFYPFRRAVKKVTGTKIKQHYYNATANLKSSIPEDSEKSTVITEEVENNVVQFKNPILEGDEIYFSYADRRDLRGIYKYADDGNHERIVYQGLTLDSYFDKHEELFVWEEIQRDIRRGNQNFSNLILYDATKKEKRVIGRREAYRSPSFSKDGLNLIFVNGYLGTESGIMMMNIASNAILEIIKSKDKQFLYPIQSEDGKHIYSIIKEQHDYYIGKINLNGNLEKLTDWKNVVYGPMKLADGHLIFQANFGSTDQIYAYELKTGTLKKVSDDPIGMYNPSQYSNGQIIAERPHSQGFLLHKLKTSPAEWRPISAKRNTDKPFYLQTAHLEPDDLLEKVPSKEFEVSRYRKNSYIFNPHSWLLSADGTEFTAELYSINNLNQVSIQPSYTYNSNVRGSFLGLDINYGRWFPIYQLSYEFGLPRVVFNNDQTRSFEVVQHAISPGFILPFNFTRATYITNLRYGSSISQVWTQIKEIDGDDGFDQQSTTINNSLSFNRRRLMAIQNIFPRWGYGGLLRSRYRTNDDHHVVNLSNDFYTPGFSRNHGFKFEVDYAQQNEFADDRIELTDIFNYAHGFRRVNYDHIWSFNTNYGFPLAYPDWGFADFLYFKRIKSTLFHNYNSVMYQNQRTELQSLGVDMLFDVVFNNNVFSEITVGFRNAYMIGPLPEGKSKPYHFEFIVDIPAF